MWEMWETYEEHLQSKVFDLQDEVEHLKEEIRIIRVRKKKLRVKLLKTRKHNYKLWLKYNELKEK